MLQKCPIYNSHTACQENRDCLFNRAGGCALVLAVTIAESNEKKLQSIQDEINTISHSLRNLE